MTMKYTVQHVGYPTTNVTPDMWKIYSEHDTQSAAWKRIQKATAHLEYGQWDDHYRVIAPDGSVCDRQNWLDRVDAARVLGKIGGRVVSEAKSKSSAENGKKGGRPRKAQSATIPE